MDLGSDDRAPSTIERQLVVFDFDWSLADQDSEHWIFEVLALDLRRKVDAPDNQPNWTDLIAQCLEELHNRGVTREEIEGALRIMPFHPAMIRTVKKLKTSTSPRTTLFCLSNANTVLINTILESKGLSTIFDEIVTNPAEWDASGLLNVRRRIPPDALQHQCSIGCRSNMCKGDELAAFLHRHPAYDRIIYVGDGENDLCPILRLQSRDIALCRKGFGLEKRIARDGKQKGLRCSVQYWSGAWEVEEIFSKL